MSATLDTAVVMAGGLGMRLRPYTTVLPKPLMPLGNQPILGILLQQLRAAGIRRVIVSVNYLAHLIEAVIGDGSAYGVAVGYQSEPRPLGTCGVLALLLDRLPEQFLVVNGDLLSNYPIAGLIENHASGSAAITIGTRWQRLGVDFGVIERDGLERVGDYLEKPAREYEVSIGLYAITRSTVEGLLARGERQDMPDLIRALLAASADVQALPAACEWVDIGRADQYQRAQEMFEADPSVFLDRSSA